jgi:protein-L-isoaspartate(D-aspartate) O-methyltransferase
LADAVREALARVPRDAFVPDVPRDLAYADQALSIGHGQTISQPFIVALMTDLLDPRAEDVVLEVGTGSGYQAAVLAQVVRRVYSLEVVRALAEEARGRLERLGYANVEVRCADGYQGWAEHAPFDGILVTAAAPEVPGVLVDQLRPGRRMVLPVGPVFGPQDLLVVSKDEAGATTTRAVLPVAFVPMVPGRAGPPA